MLEKNHYRQLNRDGQRIYRQIVDGIARRERKIEIAEFASESIVDAVNLDNPQFYYIDFHTVRMQQINDRVFFVADYLYSIDECNQIERKIDAFYSQLATSDSEAFLRRAHNYFVKYVRYDWEEVKNKKTYQAVNHSLIGPLFKGQGVCEGIAKAYAYLISKYGIDNTIAVGVCGNQPHAWNVVVLNGNKYHIDVTNDVANTNPTYSKPCYFHYLITDDVMRQVADFEKDYGCVSTQDNLFYKYNRVFANDKEVEDYLINARLDKNTAYFKYVGKRSGRELAELVAKSCMPRGGQLEYCVDATNSTYYFHW